MMEFDALQPPIPELLMGALGVRGAYDVAHVCSTWRDAAIAVHGTAHMLHFTPLSIGGNGASTARNALCQSEGAHVPTWEGLRKGTVRH